MKQSILSVLLSLVIIPCFSQGIVSVDILKFKEEGDSLRVSYVVKSGVFTVDNSQGLSITPLVEAGDSVLLLPRITILGANKEKVLTRYMNNSGTTDKPSSMRNNEELFYDIRVPYRMWMDSARMSVRQEVSGYRDRNFAAHYRLNDRVELAPRIAYHVRPASSFIVPPGQEKFRKRYGKAYLDYPVGSSVIQPSYRRNPQELLKIESAVREVINNQDAVLLGMHIQGFASPEGAYATNERLSRERAAALKEYVRGKFSLNNNLFRVASVGEDWDGLVELVKASDMAQKEKVLGIISAVGIHDGREAALMWLDGGVPYQRMSDDMFPQLRRVEYRIDYLVKDYDVEEAKNLLDKNPGDLSQYELYNLALSYGKNSETFDRIIIEIIPRYFPEDEAANNNAAAAMLENGETAAARRHLNRAGQSVATVNNLGIVCLLEGDLEKAEEYFRQAIDLGCSEATGNLKEVHTKRADNKKMEHYKHRK